VLCGKVHCSSVVEGAVPLWDQVFVLCGKGQLFPCSRVLLCPCGRGSSVVVWDRAFVPCGKWPLFPVGEGLLCPYRSLLY